MPAAEKTASKLTAADIVMQTPRTCSISSPVPSPRAPAARGRVTPGRVRVVTSVMLTFISFWRTAAVVLCDLASTAYYIGGIVERSIGPAAPRFLLAVLLLRCA